MPLSYAAEQNEADVLTVLVGTAKVNPDTRDIHGMTPLSYAYDRENGIGGLIAESTSRA